jgi:hypothetical protein
MSDIYILASRAKQILLMPMLLSLWGLNIEEVYQLGIITFVLFYTKVSSIIETWIQFGSNFKVFPPLGTLDQGTSSTDLSIYIWSSQTSFPPITVAAPSKAWNVFAGWNAGIVRSNPTQRHRCLCLCLFCVCVVLCVDSGLVTGWSPVQEVLPTVCRIKKLKK